MKKITKNGIYFSGTAKGATAWMQELVEKYGPDATIKDVAAAHEKESGRKPSDQTPQA